MAFKSLLNGTQIRHRNHPALVAVPIGAWTTAALLDLIDRYARDDSRVGIRAGADASIALGVVAALPSAATGLADWVDTYDHPRRVGVAHALANGIALGCYATSLALRLRGGDRYRGSSKALAAAGYAAVTLGGTLGGELVYTLGFNAPHTLYPRPPLEERDVLASVDLPEATPVTVQVDWMPVLLYRRGGTVRAVQHWCPHAGGPLADGDFDGDVVECPWHQSRFRLSDGAPVQGPAAVPLRTFAVREQAGRILIRADFESLSWPPSPKPPEEEVDHPLHLDARVESNA